MMIKNKKFIILINFRNLFKSKKNYFYSHKKKYKGGTHNNSLNP